MDTCEKISADQASPPTLALHRYLQECDEHPHKEEDKWSVVGQPYAVTAIQLAVAIKTRGYNLFVMGSPGTGKYTAVKRLLRESRQQIHPPADIAYCFNFKRPSQPEVLYFEKTRACEFKKELRSLIKKIRSAIRKDLQSDSFKREKGSLISASEDAETSLLAHFEERLASLGFSYIEVVEDEDDRVSDIVPLHRGEPTDFDSLYQLVINGEISQEIWSEKRKLYFQLLDEMRQNSSLIQDQQVKLSVALESLRIKSVKQSVSYEISQFKKSWSKKQLVGYLDKMENDILSHLDFFMDEEKEKESHLLDRYDINIIIDSGRNGASPVITEPNPTITSLFGTIGSHTGGCQEEQEEFMSIQAGSLARANGGFLILWAEELLENEELWTHLRRYIKTGLVEISEPPPLPGGTPPALLRPQPIKIQTKLVVLASESHYERFREREPHFEELFKTPAEFRSTMPQTPETLHHYIRFIYNHLKKEGLREITPEAIGEIVSYGIQQAGDKNRLSTRFSLIGDLLGESNHWADQAGSFQIDEKAVKRAQKERQKMLALSRETINREIGEERILMRFTGSLVGSVNALAVIDHGYCSFGFPIQVTASVGAGKGTIINIERESGLSGGLHDKGVLILTGYLRGHYSRHTPLALNASLCVEQSYSEIEGDSASAAELLALLSAISNVPLKQEIAVTGSVNQLGELQPVGSIPEKVEGFFQTCKTRGLTGKQGVLIPKSNLNSLMLPPAVVEAVRCGEFHIYTARCIGQAILLLIDERGLSLDKFERKVTKNLKRLSHPLACLRKNYLPKK